MLITTDATFVVVTTCPDQVSPERIDLEERCT
jgi:hypothetical protein